jgi:ADP-heptose:LPS heptosyltransferase
VGKLLLKCGFAPGDGVMLTAAVRDLHRCYPGQFTVDVRTPYPDLWRHNPYLTPLQEAEAGVEVIECDYPLLQSSNTIPCHFLHGFIEFLNDKLGLAIRPTEFRGDIHLSAEERSASSQVEQLLGRKVPYWLIAAGGKFDLTIKWWETQRWQKVVDHFQDRVLFVQVGSARHFHPPLEGVLDLRGWTSLRQLIHLVHHAQGVLSPVTFLMHLAAAVPAPAGRSALRPCVVVAGGREAAHWEAYPGHQYLHTVGALPCCADGGCWKKRTVPLGDGEAHDEPEELCTNVVERLPRCMDLITPKQVTTAMESYFHGGAATYLKSQELPLALRARTVAKGTALTADSVTRWTARWALERFTRRIPPPPRQYDGRGIVMAASGFNYFVCAWVCLRLLRHLGCNLPIELWHRSDDDWSAALTRLVRAYDVQVVEAAAVLRRHPADIEHPFALKPYAVVHSRFRDALWLDADQVPVQNPEFLFHSGPFRRCGAVFWPDFNRFAPTHPMWRLTGVAYRDEPEVQAGELLIDKERCWEPLRVALWFNEHHRFFYRFGIGDKDTWRFAWHKLGRDYAMPPFPVQALEGTMCQHDFAGGRLFQHRNRRKWVLDGTNADVAGFQYQNECLGFLEELRSALPTLNQERVPSEEVTNVAAAHAK